MVSESQVPVLYSPLPHSTVPHLLHVYALVVPAHVPDRYLGKASGAGVDWEGAAVVVVAGVHTPHVAGQRCLVLALSYAANQERPELHADAAFNAAHVSDNAYRPLLVSSSAHALGHAPHVTGQRAFALAEVDVLELAQEALRLLHVCDGSQRPELVSSSVH